MSYSKYQNAKVPSNNEGGPGPRQSNYPNKRHVNRILCRTSDYKPPGSKEVGLSPKNQPSKVVWELDYCLQQDQFEKLSKRFPGIAFVQTGFGCHDHPIAHTSYRIVWENVLKKLKPGQLVADISGNPAHNERFNKAQEKRDEKIKIDTFCKVVSVKDSIRQKVRWGPAKVGDRVRWEEVTLYDMYRNEENQARFAKYDVFLLNQVLYYYTMEEMTRLLVLNPEAVAYATIHKLPEDKGFINCGEQKYEKHPISGKVVQTNVETGEFYEHADPAQWFSKFCYADEHGAIAWTVNKGCEDTYVVTITSTDPKLVPEDCWKDGKIVYNNGKERIVITTREAYDPPPAYPREVVVIKSHDLIPGYNTGKEIKVEITHPKLYETLKSSMINKPRNPTTLRDLTAKAHREVGNNKFHGHNEKVEISTRQLTEHIYAAWKSGAEDEDRLFSGVIGSSPSIVRVNQNLAGKTVSLGPANAFKQALRTAIGVNAIMRSKDSFETTLRFVDDLL